MSKYIDAEKCKLAMSYYGFRAPDMTITEFIEDECPAADVAEVKHGHWIDKITESESRFLRTQVWCSVCGKRNGIGRIEINWYTAYCPNCGAKMDEEREDKE